MQRDMIDNPKQSWLIRMTEESYGALSWRLLALAGAILTAVSCSPEKPEAHRLIDDSYSEARINSNYAHFNEVEYDFTTMTVLEGVSIRGARYRLRQDGLLIKPILADPIIGFKRKSMRFNFIRIEMASTANGDLRVYWRTPDSVFAEERSRKILVKASIHFKTYTIDLTNDLDPEQTGYRFRIDPINNHTEVRVKRVSFSKAVSSPALTNPVQVGKVKIDHEVREALMLRADSSLERSLQPGRTKKLRFGLARSQGNQVPISFRITCHAAEEKLLFEETLGVEGEVGWVDHEVVLPQCPEQGCKVTFSAVSTARSEVLPALFVSNPTIISGAMLDHSKPKLPHVILISADTLGARHISALGGPAGISKHIDALARRGVLFANAFANSSITDTSHASLLTGSSPLATSYYWLDGAVDNEITLADILRRNGYLTAAFSAGVLVSEARRFDRGFETFYQHDTLYRPVAERTDIEEIAGRALSWIRGNSDSPFFVFMHSYETHGPYFDHDKTGDPADGCYGSRHMRGKLPRPPGELAGYLTRLSSDGNLTRLVNAGPIDITSARDAYRSEIRMLDQAIGRFLDELTDQGVLDNAIVAFTADHGEAFSEHGLLQHGLLYDENLRVPIILSAPRHLPKGVTVPQQVSLVDVAPTLLDIIGLPIPSAMEGSSMLPLIINQDAVDHDLYSYVPNSGLSWQVGGRYKLIIRAGLTQESFGHNELFDLVVDPFEQRNLLLEDAAIPSQLQQQVRRTIDQFPGVHIGLGALAGSSYEFELKVWGCYAFNLERLSISKSAKNTIHCVLKLSKESRLIIKSRQKGYRLAMTLQPLTGGEAVSLWIETPDKPHEIKQVPVVIGGDEISIEVWRVNEPVVSVQDLSHEEEDQLRALGYIQ